MSKCPLSKQTIEDKAKAYNAGMELRIGLIKQIKKENPEYDKKEIAKELDDVIIDNSIPQLFDEILQEYPVYRNIVNTKKEEPVAVFDIEKTKGGYKMLYLTPNKKARVLQVNGYGTTSAHKAAYNMDNLVGTYNAMNKKKKAEVSTVDKKIETMKSAGTQTIMKFNSASGSKIDFTKDNSTVINAELINDMSKSEEILNNLIVADQTELSTEHENMLRETLRNLTDDVKKLIPDMIQVINTNANKTSGQMVMSGKDKGVWVGVNRGAQVAGNQMSAAEVYVHEMKHAVLEFAQKDRRAELADTMSDVMDVYKQFLVVVKEEDFMPEPSKSINRTLERQIAKDRIAYLKSPKVGVNEFIVMSETNMVVAKVLAERVDVKKDYGSGGTLFDKLMRSIVKIYDWIYSYIRGTKHGLDGAQAMTKYIQEISSLNNVATEEINGHNIAVEATAKLLDTLNSKGNKFILKFIDKLKAKVGTKDAEAFLKAQQEYMRNKNDNKGSAYQDLKFMSRMLTKWMASDDIHDVGSFETWLEVGPGQLFAGLGFEFLKPEGDIQQLIRGFRESDLHEQTVESIGLITNKVEQKAEEKLHAMSLLINGLFKDELSKEDSEILTKGVLEVELDSLIHEQITGSQQENINTTIDVLTDKDKLQDEIDGTEAQIRAIIGDRERSNFVMHQAKGLGEYMITGKAGSGQLMNSFMIYGMSKFDLRAHKISNENQLDKNNFRKAHIDKLATLYAIKNNDENVNKRTADILKKDQDAVLGLMKYDIMARNNMKSAEKKENEFNMSYVKGHREKINTNWITYKLGIKNAKQENIGENFNPAEGLAHSNKFSVYIKDDYTEPGWASEGTRRTNDGQPINSYIDVLKADMMNVEDAFDLGKHQKINDFIKLELAEQRTDFEIEMQRMKQNSYTPSASGMRPVFAVGKKGEMFITDMDISVHRQMLENQLRTKNSVDSVVGHTLSRSIDIIGSKETSKMMLDEIERDMNENYLDDGNYWSGGKKNLMTYVKLGPNENNKINKEIWSGIPRYLKLNIFERHIQNTFREIASIAEKANIPEDLIYTDNVVSLEEELKSEMKSSSPNEMNVLALGRKLNIELTNNLRSILLQDSSPGSNQSGINKKEMGEIREKLTEIQKTSPYIAVRRNMVYHQFGNRDPMIFKPETLPKFNMIISLFKKLDMLWKEIVKVAKVNIVLRDLPVLMWNVVSNVLLAVLYGQNPITEVVEQFKGMKQIHSYLKDQRAISALDIKLQSGTASQVDHDERDMLQSRINRNPAKPLIDAGLYTSAAEDLSNEELHKESYFDYHTNKIFNKVPKGIKDVFDVLYITKGTSAFGVLLKGMQYSDFGARYARYNRLMRQPGMTSKKAIKSVLDNQINYNFSHGKVIQWLNARGFALFTKFFEGIQRVVKNVSIEKPFNTLMAALSQGFMFEDSPLGDSMFARNIGGLFHDPTDILGIIDEKPALAQILTGKF